MKYFLPVKTLIVIQGMHWGFDAFKGGSIDKDTVSLQPQLIALREKEWHFKEHKQIKIIFHATAPDNQSVRLCVMHMPPLHKGQAWKKKKKAKS